jgi:polyisoprenoid-binding protein YceI
MKPNTIASLLLVPVLALPVLASAADYTIDTKGAHASINFRIQHLGFSWLHGRFNDFSGTFSYDETKPEDSAINVEIQTQSVDSNHAERDKHLRSADFLNVDEFPTAKFVSTSFTPNDDGGTLSGDFTLNGVTNPITIDVEKIGGGKDPWGGERVGFSGSTSFKLKDYNINYDLGPASESVELQLAVEGIKQ